MLISCIRCGKLIDSPDKKNARYVTNKADTRLHGDSEFDEFEVQKDEVVLNKFSKFNEAQEKREIIVKPIEARIKSKRLKIIALSDEIGKMLPEADKTVKMAELIGKNAEIALDEEEISKTRIVNKPIIKSVPKTGIICLDSGCQNPDDIIIWG